MKTESQVVVRPARRVRARVTLPGDKSISHRYAMLSGIAEGPSLLENYSTGADCASTLGCMRALGVKWERKQNVIEGQGSGILSPQTSTGEMIGDESLSRRPMERVIKPLTAMGAHISSDAGKPPLRI